MQPAQPTVLQPSLEQRIHHAAWASVAVIVLSALLQLLRRDPILNWLIIVDILLVSALAYALYRKSRFAAVALPVYFLGAGLWQLFGLHHGAPLGRGSFLRSSSLGESQPFSNIISADAPAPSPMPPNKRLKLTGPVFRGRAPFCAPASLYRGAGCLRPPTLAPQLKRDPLGSVR